LKIAIYFEQYSWGGTDTHLLNLLREWSAGQDELFLFSNAENEGFFRIKKDLEKFHNLSLVTFPSRAVTPLLLKQNSKFIYFLLRVYNYFFLPVILWRMKNQAMQLLKKYGPFDALISDNGGYPAAWGCLAVIHAAWKLGIQHRILLVHHAAQPVSKIRSIFERAYDDLTLKRSSRIVAVSEATKQSLYDIRGIDRQCHIDVIYNGIDLAPLGATLQQENSLRKRFSSATKKLIGVVGVIESYKGHDDLIEALNQMGPEYLNRISVLFIGKGKAEEINRLKSLMKNEHVKDAVNFTGYIEGNSREIISMLDLLCVLTKDFEGFGLTLAEAMSVGVPVMATRVGAIPEFIEDGVHGRIISACSPREVKLAIEHFIDHHEAWENRLDKAKERIKEFSAEKMAREFGRLLEREV